MNKNPLLFVALISLIMSTQVVAAPTKKETISYLNEKYKGDYARDKGAIYERSTSIQEVSNCKVKVITWLWQREKVYKIDFSGIDPSVEYRRHDEETFLFNIYPGKKSNSVQVKWCDSDHEGINCANSRKFSYEKDSSAELAPIGVISQNQADNFAKALMHLASLCGVKSDPFEDF